MNAVSQAITPELISRIAYLAVLCRAEFPNSRIDLSPWLTDQKTQCQLDPYSIDFSFYPSHPDVLTCQCVFMQVHFAEDLLRPTCQLSNVSATGYICTEQQWAFSTEDWAFVGLSLPQLESQERFKQLIDRIGKLFKLS